MNKNTVKMRTIKSNQEVRVLARRGGIGGRVSGHGLALLSALICCARLAHGAETLSLCQEDFSTTEVGKLPEGMLVLDGGFAVREEGGNKFLELPGAPLETYGVLFGPANRESATRSSPSEQPPETGSMTVTARVFGTGKGRRFPTFAVGLGGVGGYRLQVSPGKKELELFRGEVDQASVPFTWSAGEWLWLKLHVRSIKEGEWKVEGKAWKEGTTPPSDWTITWSDTAAPKPGRASVWGCPFAGTPIRFDDLSWERTP